MTIKTSVASFPAWIKVRLIWLSWQNYFLDLGPKKQPSPNLRLFPGQLKGKGFPIHIEQASPAAQL
jgi:hypothetical protein